MASHPTRNKQAEIVAEKERLESVFRSYDHENILRLLKTSRLSREGDITDLIDRLVRFACVVPLEREQLSGILLMTMIQ